MGILSNTLLPSSAYAARKAGLWDQLMEELSCCLYPAAVDAFERRIEAIEHTLPKGWREQIDEEVEKHRIAMRDEDITEIMRRFDF